MKLTFCKILKPNLVELGKICTMKMIRMSKCPGLSKSWKTRKSGLSSLDWIGQPIKPLKLSLQCYSRCCQRQDQSLWRPRKESNSGTVFENHPKCRICILAFPPIFVQLKLTCLVTLFDLKLHVFKNSPKWTIFGIFNWLLSTKNVNVARFARNVEWDFFMIFKHREFLRLQKFRNSLYFGLV